MKQTLEKRQQSLNGPFFLARNSNDKRPTDLGMDDSGCGFIYSDLYSFKCGRRLPIGSFQIMIHTSRVVGQWKIRPLMNK